MDDRLKDALDIVVGRTKHERFRELCDESHPDYNPAYIPVVLEMAGIPQTEPTPKAPPLLIRAANFAAAVVSHVAAGMPAADPGTVAARLAVCGGCDQRLPGGVCAGCGCNLEAPPWRNKAHWLDSECPESRWPE